MPYLEVEGFLSLVLAYGLAKSIWLVITKKQRLCQMGAQCDPVGLFLCLISQVCKIFDRREISMRLVIRVVSAMDCGWERQVGDRFRIIYSPSLQPSTLIHFPSTKSQQKVDSLPLYLAPGIVSSSTVSYLKKSGQEQDKGLFFLF